MRTRPLGCGGWGKDCCDERHLHKCRSTSASQMFSARLCEHYRLPGGLCFIIVTCSCLHLSLPTPYTHTKHPLQAWSELWRRRNVLKRRDWNPDLMVSILSSQRRHTFDSDLLHETCSRDVGFFPFFFFFLSFYLKVSSPRRNGFAGLLWSPLYDSFICFSHILFRASLDERCFELGAREIAHTAFPLRLRRWHGGPHSNQ